MTDNARTVDIVVYVTTNGGSNLKPYINEDKEIVFLCRSINYYHSKPTKDNIRFVLDNILKYFEMFGDAFK